MKSTETSPHHVIQIAPTGVDTGGDLRSAGHREKGLGLVGAGVVISTIAVADRQLQR